MSAESRLDCAVAAMDDATCGAFPRCPAACRPCRRAKALAALRVVLAEPGDAARAAIRAGFPAYFQAESDGARTRALAGLARAAFAATLAELEREAIDR